VYSFIFCAVDVHSTTIKINSYLYALISIRYYACLYYEVFITTLRNFYYKLIMCTSFWFKLNMSVLIHLDTLKQLYYKNIQETFKKKEYT